MSIAAPVEAAVAPNDSTNRPEIVAQLQSVTKRYGFQSALNGISLELRRGEVVALLGPNGAGKTTAVRLLLGLIAATAGNVRVLGGNPRENRVRRHIGAMLQVARVPETLRVREHIDLFRSYYPNPLPLTEIVDRAQLEQIQDKFFGDLSGGQKQRVLFALALCGNPEMIFLDEPTVGLDIQSRRGLWQQIRQLAARGKTVLLTTHYLEEADALADRIVVINKGNIIAEGTPAEIKQLAAGKRIRCNTSLSIEAVRVLADVISVEQDRDAIVIRTSQPEAVIRQLMMLDPSLSGLEVTSAGLEDAFLALTESNNR
jgi:ABC-2 type transport system ATP-binding protein